MKTTSTAIGVFSDHAAAEAAIRKLAAEGFAMRDLGLVGKGYHTDEKVIGFYNMGDRVRFWGSRGALWGGLWGLFFGGMVLSIPVAGQVIVLGYLATTVLSALEGAAVAGGIGAIGAALYSSGIPENSVIDYETALVADSFLVMARGSDVVVARARDILETGASLRVATHEQAASTPDAAVPAA